MSSTDGSPTGFKDNRTSEELKENIEQHQNWEGEVAKKLSQRFNLSILRSAPKGDRIGSEMVDTDRLPDYYIDFGDRKLYLEIKTTTYSLFRVGEVAIEKNRLEKCILNNALIVFVQSYKNSPSYKIVSSIEFLKLVLNFGNYEGRYYNLGKKPCYVVPIKHFPDWMFL